MLKRQLHIHHIENGACLAAQWQRCHRFLSTSPILSSNLPSWNNHTFNEVKQCNYKIGTAILPLRYYNLKSIIKSVTSCVAHLLSLGISHLLSINPLAVLKKGQLDERVSEHGEDSFSLTFSSRPLYKMSHMPIKLCFHKQLLLL